MGMLSHPFFHTVYLTMSYTTTALLVLALCAVAWANPTESEALEKSAEPIEGETSKESWGYGHGYGYGYPAYGYGHLAYAGHHGYAYGAYHPYAYGYRGYGYPGCYGYVMVTLTTQ